MCVFFLPEGRNSSTSLIDCPYRIYFIAGLYMINLQFALMCLKLKPLEPFYF